MTVDVVTHQRNRFSRGLILAFLALSSVVTGCSSHASQPQSQPNLVFIISDDQSWAHTSRAGYPLVETPHFDQLANEGVYFENAFVSAPSCTPSRSAVLTGQDFWRLGYAGVLWGEFPDYLVSFQDILGDAGYTTGATGKGWGPGVLRRSTPQGPVYNTLKRPASHLSSIDLAGNLALFLDGRPKDRPFSFWIGSKEPHRPFNERPFNRFQGDEAASFIPANLPFTPRVTNQLSGYLSEIETFDQSLGEIVQVLRDRDLLDDTLIVVTSDNGMPFSRAKGTLYRLGVQVPLVIFGNGIEHSSRTVEDLVSLTDIAPTFLDIAGLDVPEVMTGRSLLPILLSDREGQVDPVRDATFVGFERHAGDVRKGNATYSSRAVYTKDYSYIRNTFPDRWPVGDPPRFGDTLSGLLKDPRTGKFVEPYFSRATAKRPAEELYDLRKDPYQVNNVAADEDYAQVLTRLRRRLTDYLVATDDPVHLTGEDVFSQYTYHGNCHSCEKPNKQ